MPKKLAKTKNDIERVVDLLERLGSIALYFQTDMNHHTIARRLGMGTQRVTAILKGLKKEKIKTNG
jgi:DNA-binding transcriptional regulator LsrR (DeoR family)